IGGLNVLNKPSLQILEDYFDDWRKLNPEAEIPERLTFTPSSPLWPSLESTPFFKVIKWTFKETEKTVGSISIRRNQNWPKSRVPDGSWFTSSFIECYLE
ncbi:hypothetical protein LZ30DRAFT_563730, partial [Colletotrichum cereale]